MALKSVMINDIISENNARMQNLKKYYPFFVLNETTFAQYKDGRYAYLDMGYITLATLRFLINENNFHERDVSYEEYEAFMRELLVRDFSVNEEDDELKELIIYIFDKLKNDGRAFEFRFFNPEEKKTRIARVKLIDSKIVDGQVYYTITSDGIEFYLDTKEVKEESKINISQLLLEKMIVSNNFRGGIDVVRRINAEVKKLSGDKEAVLKLLSLDIFEGERAYEEYMETIAKWFNDEQKLFAKNKALVDKAIERAGREDAGADSSRAFDDIYSLETELKKTIDNHSRLISETMEMTKLADKIISSAKLKKLRPVFDFNESLAKMIKRDTPADMAHILMPLFAPRINKTFSVKSIDNMLSLRSDDGLKGEQVKDKKVDFDFVYDDELLDKKIGMNFAKLFYELLDQIDKWKRLSLKEYNGILEIKFGKEIYTNRDLYAFLVHLAGKSRYSMPAMINKQETLLEEMVMEYMPESDKERFAGMEFTIDFGEEFELDGYNAIITDMSFERVF